MSSSIAGLRVSCTVHDVSVVGVGALQVFVPNACNYMQLTLTRWHREKRLCPETSH